MFQKYLNTLLGFARKKPSLFHRIVALSLGSILFLFIVPWVLLVLGKNLSTNIAIDCPRTLEVIVSIVFIVLGLIVLLWSVVSQWSVGRGTPAPIAPTQILIVAGPFKLCRNPIQLGSMLYYLGVGTFFDSLCTGLICFFITFVFGSLYHKFVEEKELLLRFGDDYRKYREETPFLIPKILK